MRFDYSSIFFDIEQYFPFLLKNAVFIVNKKKMKNYSKQHNFHTFQVFEKLQIFQIERIEIYQHSDFLPADMLFVITKYRGSFNHFELIFSLENDLLTVEKYRGDFLLDLKKFKNVQKSDLNIIL